MSDQHEKIIDTALIMLVKHCYRQITFGFLSKDKELELFASETAEAAEQALLARGYDLNTMEKKV